MFTEGYIGIAGIIGVGKSTLTKALAKELDYEPVMEEVKGNRYLPLFYKDMKTYGAMMQIWLLNHRFRQHREFVSRIAMGKIKGVVQDRTIWEDTIFAKMLFDGGLISPLDYDTYLDLFDNMVLKDLVFPQTVIYLRCRPEVAVERIKERGRDCEVGISINYLRNLADNYEKFIYDIKRCGVNVLEIEYNKFTPPAEVASNIRSFKRDMSPYMKWVRPIRG